MKVFAVKIGEEYGVADKFPTFGKFFSTILFNVYTIAGVILLILLLFGGLSIIIGAGSQDSSKIQQGQKTLTASLIGFVVIFTSYFIIQLIETLTGVQIINPGF